MFKAVPNSVNPARSKVNEQADILKGVCWCESVDEKGPHPPENKRMIYKTTTQKIRSDSSRKEKNYDELINNDKQ